MSSIFDMLAGGVSKVGNFATEKPEQFAAIADMIGKNLDPNNPFAGVGSTIAQSSLANKAANKQEDERKKLMTSLFSLLGGQQPAQAPAGVPGSGNPEQPAQQTPFGGLNLTLPNEAGPTSVTHKMGPDGTVTSNTVSNVSGTPKPGQNSVNLTDILPLSLALQGTPPVDLTGLTPEQIATISQNDLALGQLGNQTLDVVSGANYKRAASGTARVNADTARANALAALNKERRANRMEPLDIAKTEATTEHLKAQAADLRLKKATTEEQRGILRELPEGTKLSDLSFDKAYKLFGPVQMENFISKNITESRLTEIQKDEQFARYTKALSNFGKDEQTAADVVDVNKYSPDNQNFGFIWDDGSGFFNAKDAIRVEFTGDYQGFTMEDVRATAKDEKRSVEDILLQIANDTDQGVD